MKIFKKFSCIFSLLLILTGCSSNNNQDDPMEPTNRLIFRFNLLLNDSLLVPLAKMYGYAVPVLVQERVSDVLYTMRLPFTTVCYALENDKPSLAKSVLSFLLNVVFGFFGTVNVSAKLGIAPKLIDVDAVLKSYKAKPGQYIMLPVIGPSTTRGIFARMLSFVLDPLYIFVGSVSTRNNIYASEYVGGTLTSKLETLPVEEDLRRTSDDLYVTLRSIYMQHANGDTNEKEDYYIDESDL